MYSSVCRLLSSRYQFSKLAVRLINQNASFTKSKQYDEQIDYLKTATENVPDDWTSIKTNVLSKLGNLNNKNIDAVMLKFLTGSKHFSAALSFAEHLRSTSEQLPLGTIKGLLALYTEMAKSNPLTKDQKDFILNAYTSLYKQYKVLEFSTCEKLVQALCVIDEWEKAIKVLADIHLSCTPSHSAYSSIIATLFKVNKKKKALQLIEESLKYKRPLLENAYKEWTSYVMRKYKDQKVRVKHLDEICSHVAKCCAVIDMNTACHLKEIYKSVDWDAQFTAIRKQDGQCSCCKTNLDSLTLSNEEFTTLQQNIKDKLIVGSDLFLKTSPDELQRFLEFVDRTAPYDIVLDALNISYAVGKGSSMDRLNILNHVVNHFVNQQKKVMVLGRKHMLRWPRRPLDNIVKRTCTFFTEDISQDDPFFITAAIMSGSHTDILSKDLLRGHKFQMKDENLKKLFKRWQWQHQWMLFLNARNGVNIQPPLTFTPCAQKKNGGWHLPYDREIASASLQVQDGIPDLTSWLCLRPK